MSHTSKNLLGNCKHVKKQIHRNLKWTYITLPILQTLIVSCRVKSTAQLLRREYLQLGLVHCKHKLIYVWIQSRRRSENLITPIEIRYIGRSFIFEISLSRELISIVVEEAISWRESFIYLKCSRVIIIKSPCGRRNILLALKPLKTFAMFAQSRSGRESVRRL